MTSQNGRAFNEWLRAQLKAKKMSQRQLAQQSGVDHSTISRLIRGDRMPSLGTATKLARGLREIREDADTAQYLGLVASGAQNPTARVEYALRADESLSEPQVRQIMEYYLAVRMRRFGRAFQSVERTDAATATHGSNGGNGSIATHGANGGSHAGVGHGGTPAVEGTGSGTARAGGQPVGRSLGYASSGLVPRVGIATRVTPTQTLPRPGGRSTDRY